MNAVENPSVDLRMRSVLSCHSERSEDSNGICSALIALERPAGFFAALRMTKWGMRNVFLSTLVLATSALAADRAPFLSPAEALKTFQLEPGLRIELVVAEPLVVDPVAFAFDDQQRLYVVENRGYPGAVKSNQTQPDADAPKLGRIARLEDTDGDGRYDKRTEFVTDLSYPNGIAVWRGGVFVTCSPDIFYFKDTDNDGVADEKRVVLTGFETTRTTQLRMSFPTLGLDGKFYVASGLNAGKVTSPAHPEREPVSFTPSDGRFDPDTFVYERTGGRGQFGLTFDAFGRRFVVSNRHPVLGIMLEPWHLRRNPHLAFTDTAQEVSKVEAAARVFPISRSVITADFMPGLMSKPHAGTFTSACATLIFNGTGLAPEHMGNVFICEPAQNLVQRQVIRGEGASFRSDVPYQGREFLASTDVWFRPVFLASGPDGALYVADMNRREIDHPQYVPEESRGLLDFESGRGTGRIYRIVRNHNPPRAATNATVKSAPAETLDSFVADLDSPEGWTRTRAQRRLLERKDAATAPALAKLLATTTQPESRTAALWALQALDKLSPLELGGALRSPIAEVREQAVLLSASQLTRSSELLDAVLALPTDPSPRVRFVAALVLGSIEDPRVVKTLANIAAIDGADRWTRAAVLSGIGGRMTEFQAAISSLHVFIGDAHSAVMEDFGRCLGAGGSLDAVKNFFAHRSATSGGVMPNLPALVGLVEGLRGRAEFKAKSSSAPFATFSAGDVERALAFAAKTAAATAAEKRDRLAAVALLGATDFDRSGAALGQLLDARHPPEIQLQAVRALDRLADPRGAELLVQEKNWTRYTASVRESVVTTLTAKPKMTEALFGAIRAGIVKPSDISSPKRTQLMKHADAKIREAAEALFQDLESGDRMKVYREYRALLAQPGKAAGGAAVFTRACSACHTHQGVGGKVGPDLTGVRNQPADALLLHILVPNYEVVPAYQTITIATDDSRNLSGWLAGETDNSLTLRTAFGTEETVLRKNIATFTASSLSLMPDGLEQTMTKPELVDLIAFLKAEPAR